MNVTQCYIVTFCYTSHTMKKDDKHPDMVQAHIDHLIACYWGVDTLPMENLIQLMMVQKREAEGSSIPKGAYRPNMTRKRIEALREQHAKRMPAMFRRQATAALNDLYAEKYITINDGVVETTARAWDHCGLKPPTAFVTKKQLELYY